MAITQIDLDPPNPEATNISSTKRKREEFDSEQETESRSQVRRMMQMLDVIDHTSHQSNLVAEHSGLRHAVSQQPQQQS